MYCICKEICQTAKFKKEHITTKRNKDAYRNGFFRCRECKYYIKDFTYCPCCRTRLSIAPRNAKCKREYYKDLVRY
jgi:lipopolysaccharide biosynthesis regulator YciM